MNFTFPSEVQPLRFINSKIELSKLLTVVAQRDGLSTSVKYTIKTPSQKYVYAKCRYCEAHLRYSINKDGKFELGKAKLFHQHRRIRTQIEDLKNAIKNLPDTLNGASVKSIIRQQYTMSNSTFYRIFSAVRNQVLNFQELVSHFHNQGFYGYYEPLNIQEGKLPTMIIVTNETAKLAYKQFGSVVSFDITYNLFRDKSPNNLDYRLGILAGLSSSMKIIPFAFVIIDEESTETLGKVFYQMFRLLGNSPQVIISDEQSSIKSGLDLLRYENIWDGIHLLDSFHILKNIRKNLRIKQDFVFFKNILFAKTKNAFDHQTKNAYDNMAERQIPLLNNFLDKAKSTCFSQVSQNTFIGLAITSSINQKLNDLVKEIIPRSQKVLVAAKKISKYFRQLTIKSIQLCQFQTSKVENFIMLPQLKYLRTKICKRIFKQLSKIIIQSLKCTVKQISEDNYEVEDAYGIEKVVLIDTLLRCSCCFMEKSGIPCVHQIRLLILKSAPVDPYISSRWKFNKRQTLESRQHKRGPNKTRRNRIK